MHRRHFLIAMGCTATTLALPAYAQPAAGGAPRRGGTLKLALLGLDTADPHRHSGSIAVQQVYAETLTSIGDDGTAKPFLAERYDVSEDGKTYTFHLRRNVKFHNGRTMTARDVQANMERVRDKVKSGWLSGAMKLVQTITTPDDTTVVVALSESYAPLLNLLSELWIVAPESEGWDATIRKPIGTGPFTFGQWQPNVRFTAPAFKQYWQAGLPYLDAVQFDLRGDQDNSLLLRSGDLDIGYVRQDKVASLRSDRIATQPLGDTAWYFMSFNNRKPRALMQDARVRQAIAMSMDKRTFMNFVGGSDALTSNQPVRPKTFYWDAGVEQRDPYAAPDLAKARALLQTAGVVPGDHTLKMVSWQNDYSQVAAQMVRQLGFKIDHQALDDIGAQRALGQYDWDITPMNSGPRSDVYLRYARFLSDGPSPMLWGGIQDKELDRLIGVASASSSSALARSNYLAAWQRVLDNQYFVGLGHSADMIGVGTRVQGYRTGFTWSQNRVDGGLARTWLTT
ncbi:ABC transporter substrate-binding protein [Pigmentiphaga litoralis]|uniref:ABC-type transport system substrate-binding protein n=1 Tax=Pigmentiphaga litoralis TaxID=516702 RepID=A0A7Y9IT62_9BURK|nr:ABC transporter substrate-binding protein [Pigmentiphaga litoralis]NYE24542.1 ABC-type transport system substrate-binding protein [Pigmentiphaga litoralis]NYE81844.1 ABC-type transport system substrate-binding protein [Pigmentiphaga litoralis]